MIKGHLMEIIENRTNYPPDTLFAIAKRENNQKRKHLLVNFLQAKHIPVAPDTALTLFAQLGQLLSDKYPGGKMLVVGFAETATAIGAVVARELGPSTYYLHTSRESISGAARIVDFNEEHSHATEQTLFCQDWDKICAGIQYILFVEDEITTGKTILNFIAALRENNHVADSTQFIVASIINGMNAQSVRIYNEQAIAYHSLVKLHCDDFTPFIQDITEEQATSPVLEKNSRHMRIITVPGKLDPRTGVLVKTYEDAVLDLADAVLKKISAVALSNRSILVLGTEEFMYPAIRTAEVLAKQTANSAVFVHATTRSPIIPFTKRHTYPISSRYCVRSVYDANRKTYIYNFRKYDQVIVITDAAGDLVAGMNDLSAALQDAGCDEIIFVKWVN